MESWIRPIKKMGACSEALEWAKDYDNLDEAWQVCERGDWMLWLAGKLSGEAGSEKRRVLVSASCQCARLALPYVTKGETRPLRAIETAEKWAKGEDGITLEQVRAAADAADDAAFAAYAAYADAAYAYAYAAAAARKTVLKQCADIVRGYYPTIEVPH